MVMIFQTPREATLQAENDRLRAENAYLKQAMTAPGVHVMPWGVMEELDFSLPAMSAPNITLPKAASIKGELQRTGMYSVIGRSPWSAAEHLEVAYYVDAARLKSTADYLPNEVFPMMHEQFIRALAGALKKGG